MKIIASSSYSLLKQTGFQVKTSTGGTKSKNCANLSIIRNAMVLAGKYDSVKNIYGSIGQKLDNKWQEMFFLEDNHSPPHALHTRSGWVT